MTRVDLEEIAKPEGFKPFTVVTVGGLEMKVPHPEFIVIPPGGEESYIQIFKLVGRTSVPKWIALDAIDHIEWENK